MRYDRNPSSQELVPLDRGSDKGSDTGACGKCGIEEVDEHEDK